LTNGENRAFFMPESRFWGIFNKTGYIPL
jgi:hypothetical protein